MSCTIVLVCGSEAEVSKWARTSAPILRAGHSVVTPDIGRRRLAEDAAAVGELARSLEDPLLLVGHGYGGAVISSVDPEAGDIVGLVFVEAFAPAPGESCASLAGMFPGYGSATGAPKAHEPALSTYEPVPSADEAFGDAMLAPPLWRGRPTWFAFGDRDREIPVYLQHYMAKRAASRHTVEIAGAEHGVAASHPAETADLILEAAHLPRWAEPLIP